MGLGQPAQHGGFGFARKVIMAGEGRETARRLGREQRFAHAAHALLRLRRSVLTKPTSAGQDCAKIRLGMTWLKTPSGASYVIINGKTNNKRNLKLNKTSRWRGKSNCMTEVLQRKPIRLDKISHLFHTYLKSLKENQTSIHQSINQSSFIHAITSLKNAFLSILR